MLLGFISLLLTVGQGPISRICISEKVAGTWHPCDDSSSIHESDTEESENVNGTNSRRLLAAFYGSDDVNPRRVLAGGGTDKCREVGVILLLFFLLLLLSFIQTKLSRIYNN